jgi:hypothetical protein
MTNPNSWIQKLILRLIENRQAQDMFSSQWSLYIQIMYTSNLQNVIRVFKLRCIIFNIIYHFVWVIC